METYEDVFLFSKLLFVDSYVLLETICVYPCLFTITVVAVVVIIIIVVVIIITI